MALLSPRIERVNWRAYAGQLVEGDVDGAGVEQIDIRQRFREAAAGYPMPKCRKIEPYRICRLLLCGEARHGRGSSGLRMQGLISARATSTPAATATLNARVSCCLKVQGPRAIIHFR
jgi:hypothetical protein